MSEEYRVSGEWYIPEVNKSYSGELYINKDAKTIALHLVQIASEDSFMPEINVHGRTAIVKGTLINGGMVLLFDCDIGDAHVYVGSMTEKWLYPKYAFWGLDISNAEELCFSEVRVDFGEIINWAELCSYEWTFPDSATYDSIEWKAKSPIEFEINEDTTLIFMASTNKSKPFSINTTEYTLKQSVDVILKYKAAKHWQEILNDVLLVKNLITLGKGCAIYINEIHYKHEKNSDEHLGIREAECFLGTGEDGAQKSGHPMDYLFNLNDLCNENFTCLNNWFQKYMLLKPVIDLFTSAFNYKDITAEMLFLNLTQALDTYHARFISNSLEDYKTKVAAIINKNYNDAFQKQEPEHVQSYREIMLPPAQNEEKYILFRSRVGYLLLADFEIHFASLDYTLKEFIKKIIDTRNYYTHYDPSKEKHAFTSNLLPYVNSVLMSVLTYYVLKEIGISGEKVKEKINRNLSNIETSCLLREKKRS